jgi:hypothetical protein
MLMNVPPIHVDPMRVLGQIGRAGEYVVKPVARGLDSESGNAKMETLETPGAQARTKRKQSHATSNNAEFPLGVAGASIPHVVKRVEWGSRSNNDRVNMEPHAKDAQHTN